MIYLYTLTDPRNGNIFYVGSTINIKRRGYVHITKPHTLTGKDLKKCQLNPIIEWIDEVNENHLLIEAYWVHQLTVWGFKLENYHYTLKYTSAMVDRGLAWLNRLKNEHSERQS